MRFALSISRRTLAVTVSALVTLFVPMAIDHAQAAGPVRPSFDCRQAFTNGEKAICTDPGLAAIDRAIARRYQVLIKRLDKVPAYDLTRNQAYFISGRDHAVSDPALSPSKRTGRLRDVMQQRLNFLIAISPIAPTRADGIWINGQGGTIILEQQQAGMHFHATRVDPFDPAVRCEAEGLLKDIMPGGWDGSATGAPGRTIMVSLNGAAIFVNEATSARQPAMPDRPYCTPGADLTGTYFRMTTTEGPS